MLDDGDDVGSVASAGAFGVVTVNRAVLEGCDGRFDETAFVERVGVDEDLDIVLVGNREASVDRCRRGAPVFVEF